MSDEDDSLPWLAEDESAVETAVGWNILIVDDEPQMHAVTRMALRGLRFRERELHFLSAYSGAEARELLARQDDIALILLDVVMESDDAGLQLVRHIRQQLGNDRVRIVLRTGQAGQAPERQVVLDYDINDYKEKTELTAAKLVTCVVSSLRAYQAIDEVARLNADLERTVAERTAALQRSLEALQQGERAGRKMQFSLLPPRQREFAGYVFSHLLLPSEFMSGDFVDYLLLDDGRVLFYLADVSGHGVASAFVTVWLKRFIGAAHDTFRRDPKSGFDQPAVLLTELNQALLEERLGKHIALFLGLLDPAQGRLVYANAGAWPCPLLLEPDGWRSLEQRSTPLGLLDEAVYSNLTLALPAHFRLLLVSDGLLDLLPPVEHPAKMALMGQRLGMATRHADDVAVAFGCSAERGTPDDITVLLLRYDGGHEHGPAAVG